MKMINMSVSEAIFALINFILSILFHLKTDGSCKLLLNLGSNFERYCLWECFVVSVFQIVWVFCLSNFLTELFTHSRILNSLISNKLATTYVQFSLQTKYSSKQ